MNRFTILSAIILFSFCSYAQDEQMKSLIYPQISNDSTIIGYNEIDGKKYEVIRIHRHRWNENVDEIRLRVDGKIIDSLLLDRYDGRIPFCYNGNVYFGVDLRDRTTSYYRIHNDNFEKVNAKFYRDDFQNQAFTIDSTKTKLFVINPITEEQTLVYDFCKNNNGLYITEYGDYNKYIHHGYVWFISKDMVFLALCDSYFADDAITNYYLISNGKAKDITDYFLDGNDIEMVNIDNYVGNDIRIFHDCVNAISNIYTIDFSDKYQVLGMWDNKVGINYDNGINFYYMLTILNDSDYDARPIKYGTEVIIPYKFNPQLEIQMYRAYNDTLLSEADIEGLGKYELGILRNLLFAKHNYAFKSEFYQAYFNMYEFYKPFFPEEKRTTRKTNVDNELTANDKANIALIRKMEAKLK